MPMPGLVATIPTDQESFLAMNIAPENLLHVDQPENRAILP